MIKSLAAIILALPMAFGATAEAQAQAVGPGSPTQDVIDSALDRVPGGVQRDANTVTWDDGAVTLTVSSPFAIAAVGTCATGNFCAFGGNNLTGSKLSFTTCATYSTAALPTVKSIANARASNNVQARNSAATVIGTLAPGARDNVAPTGIASMRCVP